MSELYDIFREHPHISTDTRNIGADSIFFALRGATFDGNHFAAEALDKGAAYAVVDDPAAVTDERMVLVGDTLGALQELAREHRRRLAIPILAISGSNGKTTTKELVSRVLAERFEVYANQDDPNQLIVVERYRDQQAFDEHLADPENEVLNTAMADLTDGGSQLTFLVRK